MVDDVFFILKKCGARALASANVQCVCALLGQLNDVLANRYKAALAARLAGGAGRLAAAAPSMLGLTDSGGGEGGAGGCRCCRGPACHHLRLTQSMVSRIATLSSGIGLATQHGQRVSVGPRLLPGGCRHHSLHM